MPSRAPRVCRAWRRLCRWKVPPSMGRRPVSVQLCESAESPLTGGERCCAPATIDNAGRQRWWQDSDENRLSGNCAKSGDKGCADVFINSPVVPGPDFDTDLSRSNLASSIAI